VRIFCHAQHLSGVGHFVRMRAIARGLRPAHDVVLVHGGRPMPGGEVAGDPETVALPQLFRMAGRLSAAAGPASAPGVLAERARMLAEAVERFRPDVVLIEHYPFSKWELEPEMRALIGAARSASPGVRIVCSLRDIVRKTRYEDAALTAYEARVLGLLEGRFDAILVHGDPAFTTFEQHFGRVADLPVPVHYTGFVVEAPGPRPSPAPPWPYAVLSCGGGAGNGEFLVASVQAFRGLSETGKLGAMRLVVFPAPFADTRQAETLRAAAREAPVELRAFSPEFAGWLAGAELSVSRAGYNTAWQIVRAGTRGVLVPDPAMSDQEPRAERIAELGLATVVAGRPLRADAIAAAIEEALARRPARSRLDLGGVAGTRAIVEKIGALGGR
jgi:predicted glycosyltransferase